MKNLPIKIKLQKGFLKNEVRCGYTVTKRLKKIWAVELDLLAEFDRVCSKYAIKYQVFAGTLLGVVRHKGMIPWDDDIDVAMSREDWNRLCAVARHEFQAPYFFQTALTDRKRYIPHSRLRNSATAGIVSDTRVRGYNNGIFIDILPLDGLPNSKSGVILQNFFLRIATKLCTSYYGGGNAQGLLRAFVSYAICPFLHVMPYSFYIWIHDYIASRWSRKAHYVGLVYSFAFGKKYRLRKSDLVDLIKMPFENLRVPVPRDFDKVLTTIYGDYRKFPPIEERGAWHDGKIFFDPEKPYTFYLKS